MMRRLQSLFFCVSPRRATLLRGTTSKALMSQFRTRAGPVLILLVTCAWAESPEPKTVSSVEVLPAEWPVPLETRSGQVLDEVKVRNDVKALWRSGKFSDVRVEETADGNALHVVFRVEPKPKQLLRRIDVKPPTPGIDIQLPLGTQIDDYGAKLVATSLQQQLVAS